MDVVPVVRIDDFMNTYASPYQANKQAEYNQDRFPLYSSPALAALVGYLVTDGFLDVREQSSRTKYSYIGFFSKHKEELHYFDELFYSVFGIRGSVRDWGVRRYGESYGYIVINNAVSRMLALCGVPGGNKVLQEYAVPDWIMRGSKNIKRAFLRASFDAEGCVTYNKAKRKWEVRYNMYKLDSLQENCKTFLNQLKLLLSEFGIGTSNNFKNGTTFRKDGTISLGFRFRIDKPASIRAFHDQIGLLSEKKRLRLLEAIKEMAPP